MSKTREESAQFIGDLMGWPNLLDFGIETDGKKHNYIPKSDFYEFHPLDHFHILNERWVEEIEPGVFLNSLASRDLRCYHCGDTIRIAVDIPNKCFRLFADKECSLTELYATAEIDVPSGKLVIGDWLDGFQTKNLDSCLRRDGNILDHNNYGDPNFINVNYLRGIHIAVRHFEKLNILHMFVGNTCPGVFIKDNDILIGHSVVYEYDEKKKEESETDHPAYEGFKELCGICTDLWWVTAMDYDAYVEFTKAHNPEGLAALKNNLYSDDHIIEIPSGRYRFTSLYPVDGDDNPVYIRGSKIG